MTQQPDRLYFSSDEAFVDESFDYEGTIAQSNAAQAESDAHWDAVRAGQVEHEAETKRLMASMPGFFEAVDQLDDSEQRQRQVDTVVHHLIISDHSSVITRNFDDLLLRADQAAFAAKLINNGIFGLVENNIDKFENPDQISTLMPGLV